MADPVIKFCRRPVFCFVIASGFFERDFAEGAEAGSPFCVQIADPILIFQFQKIVPHFCVRGVAAEKIHPVDPENPGLRQAFREGDVVPNGILCAVSLVQCGKIAVFIFQKPLPGSSGNAGIDRDECGIDLILDKFLPTGGKQWIFIRYFFRKNDLTPGIIFCVQCPIDRFQTSAAIPPQHGDEITFHIRPDLDERSYIIAVFELVQFFQQTGTVITGVTP